MLRIAYRAEYEHPLPAGHRFPMEKYSLLHEQLLYEGTARPENFFAPEPLDDETIHRVHTPEYWRRLRALELTRAEERRTGFPLTSGLVERERIIAGGSVQAAAYAREHGVALNIAGGTHHAFADRGEGFCLLNDVALVARYVLDQGWASRVLVVDLDVHQGNGTAALFAHEPAVFTLSVHGRHNYPLHKEQSDLDVPLEVGTTDAEYLSRMTEALDTALATHQPDFVYYLSGVDILEDDRLGHLAVSMAGCAERDRRVLSACAGRGLPCVVGMGGGYARHVARIVEAHAQTYRLAAHIYGL